MNQFSSYVPQHLAIESMRDNGFRNAAYAIAELIDNSIQAEASLIQLLCAEERIQQVQRSTMSVKQIAILDNGNGMDPLLLQRAIQFGDGDNRKNPKGMGRFGMGLPSSSISQCRRLEVWSWQTGIDQAYYTYLDIDDIKNGELQSVPTPVVKRVPKIWLEAGYAKKSDIGNSGTLVVWSNLDKLLWRKASTIFDKSEAIFGRMYRKFLENDSVKIRMVSFELVNQNYTSLTEKYALPNDPMYLISKTTCPEPYDNTPMFRKPTESIDRDVPVIFNGVQHTISIRYSYAKDETRKSADGNYAGHSPYGKHAAENIGISILRAGRELELDKNMVVNKPMERWWGVEIEFDPALDEMMGVTNNKQSAVNLTEALKTIGKESDVYDGGKSYNEFITELKDSGDPQYYLITIATEIKNNLNILRKLIEKQIPSSSITEIRHKQDVIGAITKETQKNFGKGSSDLDENKPSEEKKREVSDDLVNIGVNIESLKEVIDETIDKKFKYMFITHDLDSSAFFSIRNKGGTLTIVLNSSHKAYEYLVEILDQSTSGKSINDLQDRLNKAADGLRVLLMAWARLEDELPDGTYRDQAKTTRNDWGRIADFFLREYSKKVSE